MSLNNALSAATLPNGRSAHYAGLSARARPRVEVIDTSGFYTAGSVDFSGDVEVKAPHLEDTADIPLGGKLSRGDLEAAFDSGARRAWTGNHQLFTLTCAAGMKQSFNFTMECRQPQTPTNWSPGYR